MSVIPKPEIEHFKKFHLLRLMSARHLNYLREKSIVVSYAKGDILFSPPRSSSMGYYLLEGSVEVQLTENMSYVVEAGSPEGYCSLEEKLSTRAICTAQEKCKVLQLSRVLVEKYFSWSTTGEYRVVDIDTINQNETKGQREWMRTFLNSPLAKNLSEKEAEGFFSHFEDFRIRAGEVIIHKGEIADYFYILKNGQARIIQPDEQEQSISIGDYFGDESLVPNAPSSVQVEMLSQGLVAKINRTKFKKLIADSLLQHVNPSQLSHLHMDNYIILDVRFPSEYKVSPIANCINIPLQNLQRKMAILKGKKIIFISEESGPRGEFASYLLLTEGIRAYILDNSISEYLELLG